MRYAVIFVGAYLLTEMKPNWLKEEFGGLELVTKVAAAFLVVASLVLAGLAGGKMRGSGPAAMWNVTPTVAITHRNQVGQTTGHLHFEAIRGFSRWLIQNDTGNL